MDHDNIAGDEPLVDGMHTVVRLRHDFSVTDAVKRRRRQAGHRDQHLSADQNGPADIEVVLQRQRLVAAAWRGGHRRLAPAERRRGAALLWRGRGEAGGLPVRPRSQNSLDDVAFRVLQVTYLRWASYVPEAARRHPAQVTA
jgi:hypothetical protein